MNNTDVDKVITDIYEIVKFMSSDTLVEMRKSYFSQYKYVVEKEFSEFTEKYYSIMQLLINGQDIGNLCMMLKELYVSKKKNISMDDTEKYVTNELSNQYVMPVLEKINNEKSKKNKKSKKSNKKNNKRNKKIIK